MLNETFIYLVNNSDKYYEAVTIHVTISAAAVLLSMIIGVPLGMICAKYARVSHYLMNTFNVLRIIPSLAVLIIVMPILGTGFLPALLALTLLAIPPILINAYLGVRSISPTVIECAKGMGMDANRILFRIEIPLAMPLMLTGLRTAAIEVIASATLAAYIGAGGLGDFIFTGIGLNDVRILLIGGVSVALLAIFAETSLAAVQHYITKYQRD